MRRNDESPHGSRSPETSAGLGLLGLLRSLFGGARSVVTAEPASRPHPSAPIGCPTFCHRQAVLGGRDRLFDVFQLPDPIIRRSLFASLLVENGIVLLTGTYGTGKTQFVHLVRKLFFSDGNGGYEYDYETCHQELTAFDVLYHLDLAELQRGREVVHPKRMLTARLKFLNEIQRANASFFNSLLPLLSERRVTYRDVEWAVPDFLCVMDRNPLDSGSSEVPEAFLDRVDFSFEIPAIHLEEHLRLQELRRRPGGFHWGGLDELTDGAIVFPQLRAVWEDVKRVDIPMPRRSTATIGCLARIWRPAFVCVEGLAMQVAPQVSIISLRKGFWSKLMRTMNTLHSSPNWAQAKASALPHCPAPVSVTSRLMPNTLL